MSSFRSEYGVKINSDEFKNMSWDEFTDLLSGLPAESPLGRMVQIRLENDENVIKNFTSSQRRIRSEWRSRQAKAVSEEESEAFLEQMKQMFISMAGN